MAAPENLSLFLVEDEAVIAMDLEALIEDMGHEVVGLVASVEQATQLLSTLKTKPDAAIVDANLGGASARPIVDQLKAAGIPTIIASGYAPEELHRKGLSGVLIPKPYHPHAIADALERIFEPQPIPRATS